MFGNRSPSIHPMKRRRAAATRISEPQEKRQVTDLN